MVVGLEAMVLWDILQKDGQPVQVQQSVGQDTLDIQELVIYPSIIQTWNDISLVTELLLCLSK